MLGDLLSAHHRDWVLQWDLAANKSWLGRPQRVNDSFGRWVFQPLETVLLPDFRTAFSLT